MNIHLNIRWTLSVFFFNSIFKKSTQEKYQFVYVSFYDCTIWLTSQTLKCNKNKGSTSHFGLPGSSVFVTGVTFSFFWFKHFKIKTDTSWQTNSPNVHTKIARRLERDRLLNGLPYFDFFSLLFSIPKTSFNANAYLYNIYI